MLTSLFSLFYVTGEFHRFLHRGRAEHCTGIAKIMCWKLPELFRCLSKRPNPRKDEGGEGAEEYAIKDHAKNQRIYELPSWLLKPSRLF